jgi:hypothetical protein
MNSGDVQLVDGAWRQPGLHDAASLGFAAAFAKVPFKVAFSSIPDETTALCDLILPDHHGLESWGDAEPVRGTLSLQQPTMDPVFDSRSTADVLLAVAKSDPALASRFRRPTTAPGWPIASVATPRCAPRCRPRSRGAQR